MLAQRSFPISIYDSCKSLYDRVAETNGEMLAEVLTQLANGEMIGKPQVETSEPVLRRRRPSDGLINWGHNAKFIYDFVRALTRPYPGAFS